MDMERHLATLAHSVAVHAQPSITPSLHGRRTCTPLGRGQTWPRVVIFLQSGSVVMCHIKIKIEQFEQDVVGVGIQRPIVGQGRDLHDDSHMRFELHIELLRVSGLACTIQVLPSKYGGLQGDLTGISLRPHTS